MKTERYSPQIGGVMVSHHNMVSTQNGDTQSGPAPRSPLPSDATEPTIQAISIAPSIGGIQVEINSMANQVVRVGCWRDHRIGDGLIFISERMSNPNLNRALG